MINVFENKECCGCSACADICPVGAIKMTADREGFLYPVVDTNKCTNCVLCEKVCPAIEMPEFNDEPDIYALQLKDEKTLKKSQSGGAFAAIANTVLEHNGVVYGASLNKKLRVVHSRAENKEEMEKFHGSKYVQTDMSGVMKLVRADLKDGKEVLFSGTACHIAGLYKYLGKEYANLTTCDLVCHGVPTPMLLEKYIAYVEKNSKKKISDFKFGFYDTDIGTNWNSPRCEMIFFDDGSKEALKKYIQMFTSNWCLRPFCHTCPFAKTERIADFTIGDFWGIEHFSNTFDTRNGVSVLFANSDKAKILMSEIYEKAVIEPACIEDVEKYQHNLKFPSKANKRRNKLMEKLINKGFISAYRSDRFYYMLYCMKQKVLKR